LQLWQGSLTVLLQQFQEKLRIIVPLLEGLTLLAKTIVLNFIPVYVGIYAIQKTNIVVFHGVSFVKIMTVAHYAKLMNLFIVLFWTSHLMCAQDALSKRHAKRTMLITQHIELTPNI